MTTMPSFFLFFCLLVPLITNNCEAYTQQKLDRIRMLPGQPRVPFTQYSGYVTVNERHGRALFYWLVEAYEKPENKPLVLWLNGGPGCSSIAYGASEEIGPFYIDKSGSFLHRNKHSWNQEANLLFLESPVGVGFSYTNTSSDLKDAGDERTAVDALVFMKKWITRFPQYKYREFFISGESYAGHYVPQLAKKIHDYNKLHLEKPFINLKGFIVGNAVTDNYFDSVGTVNYWWSHSMISDHTYRSIMSLCNFRSPNVTESCNRAITYAMNHEFGEIDQYSIYTPSCKSVTDNSVHLMRLKNTLLRRRVYGYDPCTENYAEKYYNKPAVQKAMHANRTHIPYKWTACSDVLIKNWKDSDFSILPIYKELIAVGLRIWVFSGDTDSVVPVTATRFSLAHLNLTIKTPWYPWYSDGQVAGWSEVYRGLTFATVRGAGHEVPMFQPKRGFRLFQAFLAGKELPRSS